MIIINTANLHVGGGVQVASAFIIDLMSRKCLDEYYFILSKEVYDRVIDYDGFNDLNYCLVDHLTPVQLMLLSFKLRRKIKEKNVTSIFSIFGPSYLIFLPKTVVHYVGFANPWVLYKDSPAYNKFSFLSKLVKRFKYFIYELDFLFSSDHFIVETEEVKSRLRNNILLKNKPVDVVSNCYAPIFDSPELWDENYFEQYSFPIDKFKFCTISHDYTHKQLDLIPLVKDTLMKEYGMDVLFYVTLSESAYNNKSAYFRKSTINVGVLKPNQCPVLYKKVDGVFLPTLLECFSASYPESMKMKKPIFTSDMGFARDLCKDAAFYFDPLSVFSISEIISRFIFDENIIIEKTKRANEIVDLASTSMERTLKYIDIIGKNNETGFTKYK